MVRPRAESRERERGDNEVAEIKSTTEGIARNGPAIIFRNLGKGGSTESNRRNGRDRYAPRDRCVW